MLQRISLWALSATLLVGTSLLVRTSFAQSYGLPSNNASCPGNCRTIAWNTGSDLWNGGVLPSYTPVSCTGLAGDGKTDDGPAIQSCINKAASGTAVYVPAGTYLVNSTVAVKSNMTLRGAGTTSTFFNLGSRGGFTTQNFSTSTNLAPTTSYASNSPGYALSGAPQKGDMTITIAGGSVSRGDWIAVFADNDPTLVSSTGDDGNCTWCADNTGYRVMQQIVQVSAVNGSTLTLAKPLYYTLYKNPQYRKYSFPTQKAGFEDFKATGTSDIGSNSIIRLQGCLYCWVARIETQNTGSSSGSAHVQVTYSYGAEVRDSYFHDGRSSASGANYGVHLFFVNSDHKVENNIFRHNRHGIVYEGGGSGTAILYNYIDDLYTDDLTYLGSARTSHGAHPFMNLWEGNVISHVAADNYWGSSSHFVFFRNWIWGDETGTGVPTFPSYGFAAIDLYPMQTYYSFIGNVLGHTGMHAQWSKATLRGSNEYASSSSPIVYSFGGTSGSIPSTDTTSLNHGNWDYKTNGVAYWEGGSNHTLVASLYYGSAPSFLGGYPWPLEGPEGNPTINPNPAENCYLKGPAVGGAFNPTGCYGGAQSPSVPSPPTNLTGTVR
jgi:hypothetical protein